MGASNSSRRRSGGYPPGPRIASNAYPHSASPYPPPAVLNQSPYNPYGQASNTYPHYPTYPQQQGPPHQQPPPQYPQAPPPPGNDGQLQQTSTIRNAVNLKKQSLKLIPSPDDPDQLEVHFMFDSSKACSVTTFFMATEIPTENCKLVGMNQAPGKRVMYTDGLGLAFPPSEGAPGHALKLNLHDVEDLCKQSGDTWPLVIRLETVNEVSSGGKTLADLSEGDPQPHWVQSQTTFAELVNDPQGWTVRVRRQKIWVEGTSYELQEIYGMDMADGSSGQANVSDIDSGAECVICMTNRKDTTVLPCRHMCMCSDCANQLRHRTNKCPICRETVESLLHIKLQSKSQAGASAM